MEKFVATLFVMCAVVLGVASLATSHWQEKGTVHYGLFQTCKTFPISTSLVLCANNLEGKLMPEIWKHTEWYMPILVCYCCSVTISFIACILWVTSFCQGGVGLKVATVFLSLIASGCYIGSVIMWKFEFVKHSNFDHGYSFWCAVTATICMPVGTILMIVGLIRNKNYTPVSQS